MPHDIAVRAYHSLVYRNNPLEEKAKIYIERYPKVWQYFNQFTIQAINSGYKRVGAKMIGERIRWETMLERDGYKINNNYISYMARRFMEENPLYGQIFEIRKKKHD